MSTKTQLKRRLIKRIWTFYCHAGGHRVPHLVRRRNTVVARADKSPCDNCWRLVELGLKPPLSVDDDWYENDPDF